MRILGGLLGCRLIGANRKLLDDFPSAGFDPKETLTFELQDHDRRRHLLSEISANAIQSVVCF